MSRSIIDKMRELVYIKNERIIILRKGRLDSAEQLLEARLESQDDLKQWMGWAQQPPTLEMMENDFAQAEELRNNNTTYRFLIYTADGSKLLGGIGIIRYSNNGLTAEVGYWMRTSEQRKGYTREALALLTKYLIEVGVFRVEVRCDSDNHRSMNVAISIGMKLDGQLRGDRCKMDGRMSNTMVFSIVKPLDSIDFQFGDMKIKELIDGRTPLITSFISL